MSEQTATNSFQEGLSMDFNPLVLPPSTLTHCLNGTLVTYNGNENVLLNDMGNARVETATLPPGYVPVGTASLGGIIYIASYNPLTGKSLIGSFPSPERNISKEDLGNLNNVPTINLDDFLSRGEFLFKSNNEDVTNLEIVNTMLKVELMDDKIYSGDKFKVFSEKLSNILPYVSGYDSENTKHDPNLYPKYLKFHLISTNDQGKNIYLDQDLVWTLINDQPIDKEDLNHFYIFPKNINTNSGNTSLEEYHDVVNANYDVYCEKVSGKLGLIAELETPNTFSVAYDALAINDEESNSNTKKVQLYFYLNWGNNNTGEHKNRVNPAGVFINSHKYEINYLGGTFEEDGFNTNPKNYKTPDTLDNLDYPGIRIPENYYDDDFDNISFLKSWTGVSLGTMPPRYGPYWDTDNKRKNDGTDNQYILKGPIIEYNIEDKRVSNVKICHLDDSTETVDSVENNTLQLRVFPYMPFGKLINLKKVISIDLLKLGHKDISLNLYRYYVDDHKVTIDWELNAYTEPNKGIKGVTFNIIPFTNNLDELTNEIDSKIYDNKEYKFEDATKGKVTIAATVTSDMLLLIQKATTNIEPYSIEQQSYNGKFTSLIYFDPEREFKKDDVYLLLIVINYSNEPIVIYRILHTSNIFNQEYLGTETNFSHLKLGDYLKPLLLLNISPNYEITKQPEYDFESTSLDSRTEQGKLEYEVEFLHVTDIKLNIPINNENITILIGNKATIERNDTTKCLTNVEGLDPVEFSPDTFDTYSYSDSKNRTYCSTIKLPYNIYYINQTPFDSYSLVEITSPNKSEMHILLGGNNNEIWWFVKSFDRGDLYGKSNRGNINVLLLSTVGNILLEELNRHKVDYILVWLKVDFSGGAAYDNWVGLNRFGTFRRNGVNLGDIKDRSLLVTCIRDTDSANLYTSSCTRAFAGLNQTDIAITSSSALFKTQYSRAGSGIEEYDIYYKIVKDNTPYYRYAVDNSSEFYLNPGFISTSIYKLTNVLNSVIKIHLNKFLVNNTSLPANLLLGYTDKTNFSNKFEFRFIIKNKADIQKIYYVNSKSYLLNLDGTSSEIKLEDIDKVWYLHNGVLEQSYRFVCEDGYIKVSNKYNPKATTLSTADVDRYSLRRSKYTFYATAIGNNDLLFYLNEAFFGNWNAHSDTDYIYSEYGESTPKFPSSKGYSLDHDYISEHDLKVLDGIIES